MRSIYLILLYFFLFSCKNKNDQPLSVVTIENAKDRYLAIYSIDDPFPKGSALVLNKNGDAITCFHVIAGIENKIRVSKDGKKFYNAIVSKKESLLDLAILRTDYTSNIESIQWTSRSDLKINDEIFTFVTPFGLTATFLKGYISHTERKDTVTGFSHIPFIQVTGISFPGSSGAGIFLYDGSVIGINSTTVTYGAGNGIGFVIPSGYIQAFLDK